MFCIGRTSTVLCVTVYLLGKITAGFMHWKNQYCIMFHCILVGLTKRRFYVISFKEVVSWFPYGGALSITITFKVRGRGFRGTDDGLYQVVVDDTQIKGLSEVMWIDWGSQERKWFTETRGRVNTVAMVDEF